MPRKSRGCQACRQSRKRCDEMLPSCQRCRKHNLHCSGALQGPIIINQTGNVISRHNRTRTSSQIDAALTIRQPPHKAIFFAAFQSEFISFVDSMTDNPTKPAWLAQLCDIPHGQWGTSLDLSLHATATVYCAVQAKNSSAVQEACRMYGEALSLHSRSLSQLSKAPSAALICTSVVLSLFEAIWPTNDNAYCFHLTAARDMLSASLPELSQSDLSSISLLRQVYTHVQYQSVFTLITSSLGCLISGDVARQGRAAFLWDPPTDSQPLVDRLMTELYKLGKIIPTIGFDDDDPSIQLQDIDNRIRSLWTEYQAENSTRNDFFSYDCKDRKTYPDAITAMTLAYFASANILLSLPGTLASSQASKTMEMQHQEIIDSALYLFRTQSAVSAASLSMFLPITLVALYGCSIDQRMKASTLLKSRQQNAVFKGLTWKAVQTVTLANSSRLGLYHSHV